MTIELSRCTLRHWHADDEEALARHANNRAVWLNLRDAFPHPYTREDARRFLGAVAKQDPRTYFCIATKEGEAIGSIGYGLREDVERFSSEIGYWLAEPHWNRGIATEVLVAVTRQAIESHRLNRVYALPYEWNASSCRVLEKAGYELEGRLRRSAFKDGRFVDQLMYAFLSEEAGR
jgi:RimJ/RimL family protein N-acetyltransferase